MFVAKQKRKENIVEYILYMFQIEDIIRAFKFDINAIREKLLPNYNSDEKTLEEISNWYNNLLEMMNKEGIREKGHLQFLKNHINEINDFHLKLMETGLEKSYVQTYQSTAGLVTELKQKNKGAENDIDVGLSAIYGFLLLRMQKKEISNETTEAIKRVNHWLGILSALFAKFEAGDLEF